MKYLILWLWQLLGLYSVHDRWMNVRMNKCMNECMCICGMMLTGENQCAWRKTCPVVSLSTTIPYACPGYRLGPAQWEARHCPPKASHSPSFGVGLCDAAFKAVLLNFVCVNYNILEVDSLPTFSWTHKYKYKYKYKCSCSISVVFFFFPLCITAVLYWLQFVRLFYG
jgi:hypothetical protein